MDQPNTFTDDILDSLGEGVFTVDKSFRINFFNRAAEKITGYHREHIVGKFCKHVFESTLCMESCPIARVLEQGENLYDVASNIRLRDGEKIPIRVNAAVLRDQQSGQPVGGVISFREFLPPELRKANGNGYSRFCGMVGRSKPMGELFQLIEEISDADASVLIQGESGTGKELIANAIQLTSQRRNKPYVKVNCSVFPPQLLASELFGHVRGAFTGAVKDRVGRFEMAHEGTLFLDEVAEMSPHMQLQLLRVLQDGTFERVGESLTRRVDVRIIAATNRDLTKAIAGSQFREDLFYRLNVIPIEVPPLRQRREDIPILIAHFLQKYAAVSKKNISGMDNATMDMLINYTWPGNVREMENAIECAVIRTKNGLINADALPPNIRQAVSPAMAAQTGQLQDSEYRKILELLTRHQWNRSEVARELNMGRTTLWRKMKKYGLAE